jgi:ATP-dependent DNA ligase
VTIARGGAPRAPFHGSPRASSPPSQDGVHACAYIRSTSSDVVESRAFAARELAFEPKWDGFRTLVFRDGDEILLQSRDEKPMNRYFPELLDPLRQAIPERCVIDGEVVIVGDQGLDFEALLLRIHPAESRVKLLASQMPASFVAWDLLALDDEDLRLMPLAERRARLEHALGRVSGPIHLSPATLDRTLAEDWFRRFEGAGLDGVMAKRLDEPYRPGERTMIKIKHKRTADCAVAGFRWHKNGAGTRVGSLLLGLYDEEGTLHHVGVTAAFSNVVREGW